MKNTFITSKLFLILLAFAGLVFFYSQSQGKSPFIIHGDGKLLITATRDANVKINGTDRGRVEANTPKNFETDAGEALLEATSIDGKYKFKKRVRVPKGQRIFEMTLLPTDPSIGEMGFYTDPTDHNKYRTVTINEVTWLVDNCRSATSGSNFFPGKSDSENKKFGHLYYANNLPNMAGWHIPSKAEWEALISLYPQNTYTELHTGKADFKAGLGGLADYIHNKSKLDEYRDFGAKGVFWVSDAPQHGHEPLICLFDHSSKTIKFVEHKQNVSTSDGSLSKAASVRMIRNPIPEPW